MDTSRPRYLHMFLVFVKIGLFTIGGGRQCTAVRDRNL